METDGGGRKVDRASGGHVTWAEARAIALRAAPSSPAEEVPLSMAHGCRLALPLRALVAVPGTDVSAMDGYAVAGEGPWQVVGQVLAGGQAHAEVLKPGWAVEIATGAPVPEGTRAVLPYEAARCMDAGSSGEQNAVPRALPDHSDERGAGSGARQDHSGEREAESRAWSDRSGERERGGGWVAGVVEDGRHVRRRGEDVGLGEMALGAGARVTPMVLGLAAALGHDVLTVHRRPEVAVLVTGDEVVDEGLPEPGRVRDAIGPFLPGLIEWAGGRVGPCLTLPDGPEPLRTALAPQPPGTTAGPTPSPPAGVDTAAPVLEEQLGQGRAEIVVVCGASSKGPADHLRAVLDEVGAEVLVDGVAVRPGHPQLLARLPGGRLVVGLPGNPFAALSAALTLLVPLLKGERYQPGERATLTRPSQESERYQPGEHATLARPSQKSERFQPGERATPAHPRDTRLVPVRRSGSGAVPVGRDRPGSLWGAALADALAVLPPGWDGEPVELLDLPD
ncbi:molybdopterin molybdotransferase MoeA [Nonomuraea africana]|uniref:Molybdopterin molybdenumtransferase n=1 Tax=Nonomuraea africana TaxID=46171 RepID=A0ABR9KJV4_9ACTN|nr:molybdopterin molybdotransferase MoeA [Nonomuraea africana]MBE1562294.1 molybdopterin molybdotransferase [Nonomuraea africana]